MTPIIRIASLKPVGGREAYAISCDQPEGKAKDIRLSYGSFRLLLVLAIHVLRDPKGWVMIGNLCGANTGRYLYRLKRRLGLSVYPFINNGRRGGYRWNSDAAIIQLTPQAWVEVAESDDFRVAALVKSDVDPIVQARRDYQKNYYHANKEKCLTYQKAYRLSHPSGTTRRNARFQQPRVKRRGTIHFDHLQKATGDRFNALLDDILTGTREYIG